MPGYITLLGAEQVQSAANTMSHAADRISAAVSEFGSHVEALRRILEEDRQERDRMAAGDL